MGGTNVRSSFIVHRSSFGPMLTGKMVRVRYARDRVLPHYLDAGDPAWLEVAGRLLEVFRAAVGRTRGELEQELAEAVGDDPGQLVHQGLAKLVEDRCDFEVVSGHPPAQLRAAAFAAAARARARPAAEGVPANFDRDAVLAEVAAGLGLEPAAVEAGLFADLKSEQRLTGLSDTTPQRLLQRYNVALAQAVLLRSTRVQLTLRNEPPQRYRSLLRQAKFHRLVCEVEKRGPDTYRLHLDGPLSLFTATQKYGLQLALFLPAVLHCRDWQLEAELRWGAARKVKQFRLGPGDGLVPHTADAGVWVPPEMGMFAELFRKRVADWDLAEEADVFPLGDGFWVPDFRLTHRATGRVVRLEVLGFWRHASARRHLARLREHAREPFLLAVSDQLRIDEDGLKDLPAGIHLFRNMPLPDEIARLARELVDMPPPTT
jgi:predicted nuclease of restriction endonuclease-like RecB superfamily